MAMNVPRKLKAITVPMFLKKGYFYMLYPPSKMIGGSNKIMNKLLKCYDIFLDRKFSFVYLITMPAIIPSSVVSPASCKYLCFDFFRKWPRVIASIIRNSIIKISVEIVISVSTGPFLAIVLGGSGLGAALGFTPIWPEAAV